MAIVDDYASIAAQLRRIRAEREPAKASDRAQAVGAYVTARGVVQVGISPRPPLKRLPVLARRGRTTD